jgi:hypothetical protein
MEERLSEGGCPHCAREARRAKEKRRREARNAKNRRRYQRRTPEEKAAIIARQAEWLANASPEQRARVNASKRAYDQTPKGKELMRSWRERAVYVGGDHVRTFKRPETAKKVRANLHVIKHAVLESEG